jgi:hypothetical protein
VQLICKRFFNRNQKILNPFLTCVRRRNRKKWKQAPKARSKEDKCASKWCRNARAVNSNGYMLEHCWKCRSRRLKERHPATYVLNMLRHSARKRNLPFTLTLEQFIKFCTDTGYLAKRGNQPDDLTIDRKDWNEGYHIWNIRVLTHAENSAQGADNTPRTERGDADESEYDAKPVPDDQPF